MLLTDAVAECAQLCQRAGILTELPSVFIMHGVYHKVIVQMLGVGMGSDENFMSRPCFLCKLQADFMNLLGGHTFRRRKGLHIMIKIHAVLFAVRSLGRHKFRESIFAIAVDSAHKSPPAFFICHLFLL